MQIKRTTTRFEEIDLQDKLFCYSDHRYDREILQKSLCLSGILNPIVVLEKDNDYQVVTGFRRLEVSKELNLKNIPAYRARPETSLEDLFWLSALENQTTRALNLLEKATLLAKLEGAKIPKRKIIDLFMPLIGLQPSSQKMDELMTLTGLPESLVDYILSKNLSARKFRHLKGLSKNSLAFFADFLDYLTPGASLFEEITKGLVEVAQRDDASLDEIINSCGFIQIIKDESVEKTKRLKKLREKSFALRYPILTAENKRIANRLKLLKLPPCLEIKWDRSLENKGLEIRFVLNNQEDLDKGLNCLRELKSRKVLKKLI